MSTITATPALDTGPARRRRPAPSVPGVAPLGARSGVGLGIAVLWMSLIVLIPLAAVASKAFTHGWSGFWDAISEREARTALTLTASLALGVAVLNALMGTVVAWVLARDQFPGKWLLELVIDIPFALPTIVAGLVMLTLYGHDSPVGIHLVGTRVGLFVALMFVTLPFTVRTVQPVLLDLDRDVEQAAASLGAAPFTVFRRIILPPILPAVVSGSALSFARALGEYGSLVLISSNIPYKTQIASSIIYGKLQDAQDPVNAVRAASAIAVVLLVASLVVLIVLDVVQRVVARRA